MKKGILVTFTILATITLSAFAYQNWTQKEDKLPTSKELTAVSSQHFLSSIEITIPEDLVYNIDTRFIHKVTLNDLKKATSIIDIVPEKASKPLVDFGANKLGLILDRGESIEMGNGKEFNQSQLKLLNKVDYSSDIYVNARCKITYDQQDAAENYDLVYYMTIIPEKQAEYTLGKEALIQEIKNKTKSHVTQIKKHLLEPGRVRFTVNTEGLVENVELGSTSGYPEVDELLIEIFNSLDNEWNPAINAQGEKVKQELVFFFGMQGC